MRDSPAARSSRCVALAAAGCGRDSTVTVPATVKAPPQTARLGWKEPYPADEAALVFGVSSFTVTRDGWTADISVENTVAGRLGGRRSRAPRPARQFGVLLFPNDDLDELERRNRSGDLPAIRPATSYAPALPLVLRPGADLEGNDRGARGPRRRPLGPALVRPVHERRRPARREHSHRWCGSPTTRTTSTRWKPSPPRDSCRAGGDRHHVGAATSDRSARSDGGRRDAGVRLSAG